MSRWARVFPEWTHVKIQAVAMSLTGVHAAKATTALQQLDGPHAYEYQSNGIIVVLENLKDKFSENKKDQSLMRSECCR